MQFLQQGKIDLMIATMSDTPERRKIVGIIDPIYYASGVTVLANKKAAIKTAADLKGKTVCALQGAFYNKDLQSKYTARICRLPGRAGEPSRRCSMAAASALSTTTPRSSGRWRRTKKWADFDVVQLHEWKPVPWGIAVKIEELAGPWGKFMSETVSDWLKSGMLLELEKKWVGSNTAGCRGRDRTRPKK